MKKFLIITARLLLMAGFFTGLVLVIRLQAWWHLPLGVLMMFATPPLNNLLIAIGREQPTDRAMVFETVRTSTSFLLPIIIFILLFSGIFVVARLGSPQYFFLYLYVGIPLGMVILRAVHGELPWSVIPLTSAFTRLVTYQVGILVLTLAAVFLTIAVGVMGTVMLLITLGNLAWQWLSEPGEALRPFFCQELDLGTGLECGLTLGGLHLLQLLAVYVMIYHGEKLFNMAADWVNSYRD